MVVKVSDSGCKNNSSYWVGRTLADIGMVVKVRSCKEGGLFPPCLDSKKEMNYIIHPKVSVVDLVYLILLRHLTQEELQRIFRRGCTIISFKELGLVPIS